MTDLELEIVKLLKFKLAPPQDENAIDIEVAAKTIADELEKQRLIYWQRNVTYGKLVDKKTLSYPPAIQALQQAKEFYEALCDSKVNVPAELWVKGMATIKIINEALGLEKEF